MDTTKMDELAMTEHKGNVQYARTQIQAGMLAKMYKHEMSASDERSYNSARTLAIGVLAKEFESGVTDEELVDGLEEYLVNINMVSPEKQL